MEDIKPKAPHRKYVWSVSPERREELRQQRLTNMRRGIDASKAAKAKVEEECNDQA